VVSVLISVHCGEGLVKKKDIQQVEAVAREFNMNEENRRDFGDFLESEKAIGNGGTKNERGDFTYQELKQKEERIFRLRYINLQIKS